MEADNEGLSEEDLGGPVQQGVSCCLSVDIPAPTLNPQPKPGLWEGWVNRPAEALTALGVLGAGSVHMMGLPWHRPDTATPRWPLGPMGPSTSPMHLPRGWALSKPGWEGSATLSPAIPRPLSSGWRGDSSGIPKACWVKKPLGKGSPVVRMFMWLPATWEERTCW